MATINRQDLKIIFMFGLHAAKIDKNFHQLEKELLKKYSDELKLTDGEMADLVHDRQSLENLLEQLSGDRAKILLMKTICAVSHSDGVKHEAEQGFIARINARVNEVLDLPPWEQWGKYEQEVLETLRTYVYVEEKQKELR